MASFAHFLRRSGPFSSLFSAKSNHWQQQLVAGSARIGEILGVQRPYSISVQHSFHYLRFKLPGFHGYPSVGSIVGLGTILSGACPRSPDTVVELDGNIRICADSIARVDKSHHLLTPLACLVIHCSLSGDAY